MPRTSSKKAPSNSTASGNSSAVDLFRAASGKAASKELERIDQLFYAYSNTSGMIDPEGIESLCSDLEVDHTDVRILMLAWKMQAEKQGYFTQDEWRTGLKALRADTILKLKKALGDLEKELEGVSIQHNEEDIRRWALESSGVFSCKSFFTSFFPIDTNPPFPWFKDVWKAPIPKKVQLFSWLMVLGKLLTCDILQKHFPNTLLSPNWCVLCRGDTEDLNHVFLHCPFSSTLWNRVLNELGLSWVKPQAVVNLFSLNLGSCISKRGKVLWRVIVQALCWSLWLERNKRIFEDCDESLEDVWDRVKFRVAWWVSIRKDFKIFLMSDIARDWRLVL